MNDMVAIKLDALTEYCISLLTLLQNYGPYMAFAFGLIYLKFMFFVYRK